MAQLCAAPALADPPAAAVLAGHWTYDATRSRPLDRDLRIERTVAGTLRSEGGLGPSYEFDLAGGSHSLSNDRSIAWEAKGRNAWLATEKKGDQVLATTAVTLSGDSLRMALRGKLPDGSPYERTVSYRRQGRGAGLVGLWRAIKVDTGKTRDSFVISADVQGVVTWRIPTDLQVFAGPLDGRDLTIIGPAGPTGSTIAVRREGPRRFAYVMKTGDRVSDRGWIAVSPDGCYLTEWTWTADAPDRKSELVYRRASDDETPPGTRPGHCRVHPVSPAGNPD